MPITPNTGRPVPIARRSVNDSILKSDMGRSIVHDNYQDSGESIRDPTAHTMPNVAHVKAMMTPEQDRRRYMMSSPSPAMYGGHQPSKSSTAVRPQSAMALTSPHGSNNYMNNNYNNSYGVVQHARPPSSLGLARNSGMRDRNPSEKPIMHQHSRSFGDGVTSEHVYADGMPPSHPNYVKNVGYSNPSSKPQHDQQWNQAPERKPNQSPQVPRMHPNGPRGSYNPYFASNLDLNSRTMANKERMSQEAPQRTHDHNDLGHGVIHKSSNPENNSTQDLRNAWHRLYGKGGDTHTRRPSMDHIPQSNQHNMMNESSYEHHQRHENKSPQFGLDNSQSSLVQHHQRGKQVAGPMVAPFINSGRQSPPGQCAASPNEPPGLHASNPPRPFPSPKPDPKTFQSSSHDSHSLGPAAKYPDPDMGLRKATPVHFDNNFKRITDQPAYSSRLGTQKSHQKDNVIESRESTQHHHSTRFTHNHAFCSDSENDIDDETNILPTDSIFDYQGDESDEESVAQMNKTVKESQKIIESPHQKNVKDNLRIHINEAAKVNDRRQSNYARSRSLEDVRESGDDSNVSFDIENTFLMVEPSDQSEMGTLRSKNSDVKTKLNRLEDMYAKVMKTLETRSPKDTRVRRWSIGSSETNSIRHQVHRTKHGQSSSHRTSNREIKTINKRFQRLESHVITLARSIAHISSELRTQTTMTREIENVKREIQDLKVTSKNNNGNERKRHDFDKYRGYNHPLTNPRQVNKLTRFFGQEPSWLEIFLTRLGYEQYVKNFDQEHIGMMELPYMTDEQLKTIGIPMGPRTRILQESQMCFKDDNFNIYIV